MNFSSFFHVYLCSNEEKQFLEETETLQFAGHNIANCGKKKIIWPKKLDSNHISPENFLVLKERINIEDILIVDRLKGLKKTAPIVGHINRSGISFLRGKTPIKNAQQFPDMSYIYSKIEGVESKTVQTLGPERFLKESGSFWSKSGRPPPGRATLRAGFPEPDPRNSFECKWRTDLFWTSEKPYHIT